MHLKNLIKCKKQEYFAQQHPIPNITTSTGQGYLFQQERRYIKQHTTVYCSQIKLFIKIDRVEKILVKFFRNSSKIYQRLASQCKAKKLKEMKAKTEQIFLGLKHPNETFAVINAYIIGNDSSRVT
tara:strand:+ start:10766 stop:11143 length:378 start_codon:yes stop_codon:yes gene_type:complete